MKWTTRSRIQVGRVARFFGLQRSTVGVLGMVILVTDILIRFCEQIPYAFVVVWSMKTIAEPVSAVQFGLLTTIEMATAVLVYIPVAYPVERCAKKPFVLATFVFFTLFPLVLFYSRSL